MLSTQSRAAEVAWAKKASAQLARKSLDDKYQILRKAFVTELPDE